MKLKRFMSWLLALVMTVSLSLSDVTIANVFAATSGTRDTINWSLDDDGTLTLTGSGTLARLENNYDYWADYHSEIKHIVVGGDITTLDMLSLGSQTNIEYSALEDIVIGDSVTTVNMMAFRDDTALTSVTFGSGLSTISAAAFYGCSALESITFTGSAPSVNTAGNYSELCSTLSGVTAYYPVDDESWTEDARNAISTSVTWVAYAATSGTRGTIDWSYDEAGTLTLAGSGTLTRLENNYNYWAMHLSNIQHIVVGGDITTLDTLSLGSQTNIEYSALEDIVIGDSVTTINMMAFRDDTELKSVTFGSGLSTISAAAFYGCSALESITFTGSAPSVTTAGNYTELCSTLTGVTAYYPANDSSWTEAARNAISTYVTWVADPATSTDPTDPTDPTDNNVCTITVCENDASLVGLSYESISDALTAVTDAGKPSATIQLIADDIESFYIGYGMVITLDLNGHVLQGNSATTISNSGRCTIIDSNESAVHNFKVDSDGLWNLTDETAAKDVDTLASCPAADDVITVYGGCITGGTGTGEAGGVYNSGTFTLQSGAIVGNKVIFSGEGKGGGIYNDGTFNMEGGIIAGNTAYTGAGIQNYGYINMTGGKIIANTGALGGGINHDGETITMTGGEICYNVARAGGGARNYGDTFKVGGTARITGNTSSDGTTPNNFFVGYTITVQSGFSGLVGVTTATAPASGSKVSITGYNDADYSAYFSSDLDQYVIANNNNCVVLEEASGNEYSITTDSTVTTDVTTAEPGTTVTMTAQPKKYYIVDKYYVNGVAQDGNTFVMPEENVTVKATFLYTIPKPQADIRTFYYTGSQYQFYPLYYLEDEGKYFSINGYYYDVYNDTRTEPGTQTVTVKLKDGYAWNGGSREDLTFEFTVNKGTQKNAFVYYLKDLVSDKIVAGFPKNFYGYVTDGNEKVKKVSTRFAPNIYNVRDNAEVTYTYSYISSEYYQTHYNDDRVWDWDSTDNYYTSDNNNTLGKTIYENYSSTSSTGWKDTGVRYLTIHIAPTDHYDGCTIYTDGKNFGKYYIYDTCANTMTYELAGWVMTGETYSVNTRTISGLIQAALGDNHKYVWVTGLQLLNYSFNARCDYYSFIAGKGGGDFAVKVVEQNFCSASEAISNADFRIKSGYMAVDVSLSNGQKVRMSAKGYAKLQSVSSTAYMAENDATVIADTTEEDDIDLGALDVDQLVDITEIMEDTVVGDELLEGEVSPEEVEETVEVEDLSDAISSGEEDIELEESYVIDEGQYVNLDLGDGEIDITGMGDLPVYVVKDGGALYIRSSGGGKIVSDDLSKFVKVEEGGMLIILNSNVIDESAIDNEGSRYYPVVADATYETEDDVDGGINFQYVEMGSTVSEPDEPEREGYRFGGWYTDEEFTNAWDFEEDTVSEDTLVEGMVVLYAMWIPVETLTEDGASGTHGENLTWEITADGELTIEGDGDMANGINEWASYAEAITTAKVGSDITSLNEHAFAGLTNLTEVTFTGDAPEIGENAFSGVTATVYYPADLEGWTEDVLVNYGGDITWVPYCLYNHSFTKYVSNGDATCTKDGTKTAICDNGCGKKDTVKDKGSALGHKYTAVVTKKPTTSKNGLRTYTCKRCGDQYTETISMLKIKKEPEDYTGALKSTVSFTVKASGEGLTYQWQYSKNGGRTWYASKMSGCDTKKVSLTLTKDRDGQCYRCVIKDAFGNKVTTKTVTMTVKKNKK